jgi:hypothetical protein
MRAAKFKELLFIFAAVELKGCRTAIFAQNVAIAFIPSYH